jgi:hypothetical protein
VQSQPLTKTIESIKEPQQLLDWVKSKGYVTFETKPWDLNIIGIRRKMGTVNLFDDRIYVICKDDVGHMCMWSWAATTDPGLYWMRTTMNKRGTAALVPGQYRGGWKIGDHNGKPGLVQIKTVKTFRDNNKDAVYDFDPATITEGLYGINLHRAGANSKSVDKWSAGCQVWSKDADFEQFLDLCEKQVKVNGWATFTYTLLEEE